MHVCVYDCVCSPSPLFLQHTLFRPLPLVAGIKRVIFTVVLYKQCFELPCSKVFPHLGYLFNYIWYLFINDVIVIIHTQINHSIKEVCYKLLSKSTKTEFCGRNRLATKDVIYQILKTNQIWADISYSSFGYLTRQWRMMPSQVKNRFFSSSFLTFI